MSEDENLSQEEFISQYFLRQREWAETQISDHREEINTFVAFVASKGISLTAADISYVDKIGIVATAPGLLERLIGELKRERDGLVPFETFQMNFMFGQPYAGYFQTKHFIPMAHPHFRRGMQEECHFAPRFIELFWALRQEGVSKYIGLDEDRVKLNIDFGQVFEKDIWHGAPFNDDITKIPNDIVKLRPPLDIGAAYLSMFFADSHCLDIKWSQKGEIKTFQALELKSEKVYFLLGGEKAFPARYIHAEFDIAEGRFRHFDGAVQYYSEQEYMQRRDSDFNYNAKNRDQIKARSRKLFKLNGWIETATWVELCCQFLAGNPLTFEYFTGAYPAYIVEALAKIRASNS